MQYRHPEALAKKDSGYFHPIEIADREEIRKRQDDKLVEQMAYLEATSAFYQKKLSEAGVRMADARGVDGLKQLPFTSKEELWDSIAAAPPFGLHRAAALEDIVQMQSSSGATGAPAYVALTGTDTEMWRELSARGLFACGVRPGAFEGHATQANLKVFVERGEDEDQAPEPDAELKKRISERLRNAIAFKASIRIAPAGAFEKPGVQKVSLTIH